MQLKPRSSSTLEFAEKLRHRTLGNEDDQRYCIGTPNRNYQFGILFSSRDAQNSRRGDRTDIRPSAMSLRFKVENNGQPIPIKISPSFWLYFRHSSHYIPAEDVGELWREDIIWTSWDQRPAPIGSGQTGEPIEEGSPSSYVRARYCQVYETTIQPDREYEHSIALDLKSFRQSRAELGKSPIWEGQILVHSKPVENDRLEVRVSLENTYNARYPEPSWFDVRLRVNQDRHLLETFCPLLDSHVWAQTVNCVLVYKENQQNLGLEAEQINLAVRKRQVMRPAITFEDATWESAFQTILDFASQASHQHAESLQNAVKIIQKDTIALQAFEVVFETMRRAMRSRSGGDVWNWYRHQLAIFVLGAAEYLTGGDRLSPLVLNVPTAGGKTEAFSSLALWTVAYEAFSPDPKWGTAFIKYPTKLLSSDQAQRLTHYVMHFDAILAERTNGREEPRGLGLFFGSDKDGIDSLDVVGSDCPECGQPWAFDRNTASNLQCKNGHQVIVALQDEIFPRPPTLIIGTIDKFVSKNLKTEMGFILGGGPLYWCSDKNTFVGKDRCWDKHQGSWAKHDHRRISRRARLTTVILDEAHLLREEVGSLDSHFETHYLEMARELSGRYPLCVVSTATIAQATEHCRQLGLGSPMIFPGDGRVNYPAYYEEYIDEIQHIVLSFMPRGRAIAWALPHLFGDYLINHIQGEEENIPYWDHLKPALIYCGSYSTRNQTRTSLKRHIEPKPQIGREIRIQEFSRRRFNDVGMRRVLESLTDQDAVLSTNIASVGVDLGELNAIMYFGMPYNVNEFIQSMNRTGRRLPALVCIVHNPYLERDAAFYSYMTPFLSRPEELVEAVPLNRYARRAIDFTFSTIAIAQLQHVWGSQMPDDVDLRRARRYGRFRGRGFREVCGTDLNEASVLELFQNTYRSNGDPSKAYPDIVNQKWTGMSRNIYNYSPQGRGQPEFPFGDNWIRCADGIPDTMYQLRAPSPEGILEYTSEALQLAKANIRAIYGSDKDENEDISQEETDIQDGALGDDIPTSEDSDE